MGIYVKFTKTTHQIWSCHVALASNSGNSYFSPDSVLKFKKSYQIWGKLAQEQKVTGKKQIRGWKTPLMVIGLSSHFKYRLVSWDIQCCHGNTIVEECLLNFSLK